MTNSLVSVGLQHYLVLSAILFVVGLFGAVTRRNAVSVLMSMELMLNAANINLVAFNHFLHPAGPLASLGAGLGHPDLTGQVFTIFVITIAAAEASVGIALVVAMFRMRRNVLVEDINLLKW